MSLQLYPDWIRLRTRGRPVVATCQSQGIHVPMHTLLYFLFYLQWDHDLQNEQRAVYLCVYDPRNSECVS